MTTATVDAKGRVTLGGKFAGKTVLIEEVDDYTLKIRAAVVLPEAEAWLYRDRKALASLRRGLEQARSGTFVKGPDLAADSKLAGNMEA